MSCGCWRSWPRWCYNRGSRAVGDGAVIGVVGGVEVSLLGAIHVGAGGIGENTVNRTDLPNSIRTVCVVAVTFLAHALHRSGF